MSLIRNGTLLFAILRPIVRSGARIFMRRIQVVGLEDFPTDKPVVLIANHQNAMLDPVLLCVFTPKQLHWLARADVFKNPFIRKILTQLNMMPVYRERDGVENIRDENNKIFEECFERLKDGAVISMFPEGTHRGKKQLLTFKKGLGRLAVGAIDSGKLSTDLYILPVGLDYSTYYDFGPEFLIKVGEPIKANQFYSPENPSGSVNSLIDVSSKALSRLIIDINDDKTHDDVIALRDLCFVASGENSLALQFDFYKRFSIEVMESDFLKPLGKDVEIYLDGIKSNQLNERESAVDSTEQFLRICLLGLFLPVYLAGRTFYLPVERWINYFVSSKVKDPLFFNSLRLAFWTFLAPLYSVLILSIIGLVVGWSLKQALLIIALIMLSGRIALGWLRLYNRWRDARNWIKFVSSNDERSRQWKITRHNILTALYSLKK